MVCLDLKDTLKLRDLVISFFTGMALGDLWLEKYVTDRRDSQSMSLSCT